MSSEFLPHSGTVILNEKAVSTSTALQGSGRRDNQSLEGWGGYLEDSLDWHPDWLAKGCVLIG